MLRRTCAGSMSIRLTLFFLLAVMLAAPVLRGPAR